MKNLYQLVSLCLLFGLSHCQPSKPDRIQTETDIRVQHKPIFIQAQQDTIFETLQKREELFNGAGVKLGAAIVRGEMIAFTARMPSHGRTPYIRDIFPLEYKDVVSNIGDAYNAATGIFKAPTPGVYYFTFHSYSENGIPSTCGSLYRNQEEIVSWFGHNLLYPMSASNSAIIELQPGDSVFVAPWTGCKISEGRNFHSSFSGFLLHPKLQNIIKE